MSDKPRRRKGPITWKWDINYDYIFGKPPKKRRGKGLFGI